jgi:hypothetical protein
MADALFISLKLQYKISSIGASILSSGLIVISFPHRNKIAKLIRLHLFVVPLAFWDTVVAASRA